MVHTRYLFWNRIYIISHLTLHNVLEHMKTYPWFEISEPFICQAIWKIKLGDRKPILLTSYHIMKLLSILILTKHFSKLWNISLLLIKYFAISCKSYWLRNAKIFWKYFKFLNFLQKLNLLPNMNTKLAYTSTSNKGHHKQIFNTTRNRCLKCYLR